MSLLIDFASVHTFNIKVRNVGDSERGYVSWRQVYNVRFNFLVCHDFATLGTNSM